MGLRCFGWSGEAVGEFLQDVLISGANVMLSQDGMDSGGLIWGEKDRLSASWGFGCEGSG